METTDETHDPDDVEQLQNDTQRHNDRLAMETGAELERTRIRRAFKKKRVVPDEQEFRDAMTAEGPIGARDAQADMEDEIARVEALDVLEGLRSLQQGDPINWRIYRTGASEADMNGFLDTWSTTQLTQERLRDKFGGGTYRIRGTYSNGQFAGGRTVRVAGDAQRKEAAMSQQSGGSAFNMSEFLAQQASRDAQLRREQDERLARDKREKDEADERRRKERNDLLAIVMPAVSAIGAAIAGAFGGRQDNTAALIAAVKGPDPLVLLTQLQTLQKQNQPDVLTKILPMLIDMAGSKATGGDTGWLDVIKEFAKGAGPAVGGLIEAQLKAAQAAQPPMEVTSVPQAGLTVPSNPVLPNGMPGAGPHFAPAPPHGQNGLPNTSNGTIVVPDSVRRRERRSAIATGNSAVGHPMMPPGSRQAGFAATAAKSSPSNGNADMNLMSLLPHLPWLRDVLTRMLQAAQRGKSPQVYAALFLEEVPDDVSGETVLELLGAPDWFARIVKLIPQWNDSQLYPWLDAARTEILTTIQRSMGVPPGAAHGDSAPRVSQDPSPAAAPPPRRNTDEIDRPTKIPSLTGD